MPRPAYLAIALLAAGLAGCGCSQPPTPGPLPPTGPHIAWAFEAPEPGAVVAPPCVTDDAVYVSAAHSRGLRLTGAVYALDPATGRPRWRFDADRRMLPTGSSPVLAGGRLYVGEGMHANFVCHLYCLDPADGKQLWAFEAGDHLESTPAVAGGVVFIGAGNDGVYAVDAATGKEKWHFTGDVHIDTSPWVGDGKVIVGSGPSRKYKATQVVCLDAKTGHPLWRTPTDLPAWGSPRAAGGRVYVGLATGRLTEGARPPNEVPAGALLCLDESTGQELWRVPAGDAVFQRPTVAGDRVYFGSRDGHLYAVRADAGGVVYKVPLGGPVIAPPTVVDGKVYAVTVGGRVACLAAADGREEWAFGLKRRPEVDVHVYAQPQVSGGRVYVAAEVRAPAGAVATVYCLEP